MSTRSKSYFPSTPEGMDFITAIENNDLSLITEQLVSGCAHANKTYQNKKPLNAACEHASDNVVSLLIEHGAQVNETDGRTSPLHAAAYRSHVPIMKLLVEDNADPNILSYRGNTPLHMAARESRLDSVRYLLSLKQTDTSLLNNDGLLPFDQASDPLIKNMVLLRFHQQQASKVKAELREIQLKDIERKIADRRLKIDTFQREIDTLEAQKKRLTLDDDHKTIEIEERVLECMICYTIPHDSMRQCTNGHRYCTECSRSIGECPQCRIPLPTPAIRCLLHEQIVSDRVELI